MAKEKMMYMRRSKIFILAFCFGLFLFILSASAPEVRGLRFFWRPEVAPEKINPDKLPLLLERMYYMLRSPLVNQNGLPHGDHYPMRESAAGFLAGLGEKGLPLLFDAFYRGDEELKVIVVRHLAGMKEHRRKIADFLDGMGRKFSFGRVGLWLHYALCKLEYEFEKNYRVIAHAAAGASVIEPDRDVQFLNSRGSGWRYYQADAIKVLGLLGDKKSIDGLLQIYVDYPERRRDVVIALGLSRNEYAGVYLGTMLFRDSLPKEVIADIIWAIGMTASKNGGGALIKFYDEMSPSLTMKQLIITALGRVGTPEAITFLDRLAYSDEAAIRSAVAYSVGQRARDAALPILTLLLKDREESVRVAVVESLWQFARPAVIEYLRQTFFKDASRRVREAAARTLAKINTEPAIDVLRSALRSENEDAAFYAGLMLAGKKIGAGLQFVIKAINGGDSERKTFAVHFIGDVIQNNWLDIDEDFALLGANLLSSENPDEKLRDYAFDVVASVRPKSMLGLLENIFRNDRHPLRMKVAVLLAGAFHRTHARDFVVTQFIHAEQDEQTAIYDLFEKYVGRPVDEFCIPLWDMFLGDSEIGRRAFWHLYKKADLSFIGARLTKMLETARKVSGNALLKSWAAVLASGINDERHLSPVLKEMLSDPDIKIKAAPFNSGLFERLDKEAVISEGLFELLEAGIGSDSVSIRRAAFNCLLSVRHERAASLLFKLLGDADRDIKIRAALALTNVWDNTAGSRALIKIMNNGSAKDRLLIFEIYDGEYGPLKSARPMLSDSMMRVFRKALRDENNELAEYVWDKLVAYSPRKAMHIFKSNADAKNDKWRLDSNIILAYAKGNYSAKRELKKFLTHPNDSYKRRAARVLFEVWGIKINSDKAGR